MTEMFSASEIVQAVKIKLTETRNEFDTKLIAMFAEEQRALRTMVHGLTLEIRERLLTLKDGQDGRDGQDGEPGPEGPPGKDGRDGTDGINGVPGADGRDGMDGRDGADGIAAEPDIVPLTLAMMEKLREDRLELDEHLFAARQRFERLASDLEERIATVKDGEPGPQGSPGPPGEPGRDGSTGEARGKYNPAESYRKLDRVSFNGSEWIARMDDPGPLPGDRNGWMLGAQGKKGKPGVGIETVAIDGYALVLSMSDARTMRIDLRPLFERYHDEAGE